MSQLSSKKYDDEYATKKKKLHPRPDDDGIVSQMIPKSHKKMVSGTKSISKSKLSTQKKCEVTFSEGVEEIKDSEQDNKENNRSLTSTPFKTKSPSKTSLKSVKEHIKTPFSKIKDNSQDTPNTPIEVRSKTNSVTKPTNQLNFNTEIMKDSESLNSNSVTPIKSLKKVEISTNSNLKSRAKSPLVKIKEEIMETRYEENNSNERVGEKVAESQKVEVRNEENPCVLGSREEEISLQVDYENLKEEISEPAVLENISKEACFEKNIEEDQNLVVVATNSEEAIKVEEDKKENTLNEPQENLEQSQSIKENPSAGLPEKQEDISPAEEI
jgi:hypothetical protein